MARKVARVDANQPDVVTALRGAGFHVMLTHELGDGRPDFIVTGYSMRIDRVAALLVELKTDKGTLTPEEREFHKGYPDDGPLIVARSADEILRWFGRN